MTEPLPPLNAADLLVVSCPACQAPVGIPCRDPSTMAPLPPMRNPYIDPPDPRFHPMYHYARLWAATTEPTP